MSEETTTGCTERTDLTDDEREAVRVFRLEQAERWKALAEALSAKVRNKDLALYVEVTERRHESPLLRGMLAMAMDRLMLMPTCPVRGVHGGVDVGGIIAQFVPVLHELANRLACGGGAGAARDPFAGRPCADPKAAVDAMPPDVK